MRRISYARGFNSLEMAEEGLAKDKTGERCGGEAGG